MDPTEQLLQKCLEEALRFLLGGPTGRIMAWIGCFWVALSVGIRIWRTTFVFFRPRFHHPVYRCNASIGLDHPDRHQWQCAAWAVDFNRAFNVNVSYTVSRLLLKMIGDGMITVSDVGVIADRIESGEKISIGTVERIFIWLNIAISLIFMVMGLIVVFYAMMSFEKSYIYVPMGSFFIGVGVGFAWLGSELNRRRIIGQRIDAALDNYKKDVQWSFVLRSKASGSS